MFHSHRDKTKGGWYTDINVYPFFVAFVRDFFSCTHTHTHRHSSLSLSLALCRISLSPSHLSVCVCVCVHMAATSCQQCIMITIVSDTMPWTDDGGSEEHFISLLCSLCVCVSICLWLSASVYLLLTCFLSLSLCYPSLSTCCYMFSVFVSLPFCFHLS